MNLKNWLSRDFTLTKRMVGILAILAGTTIIVGSFIYDILRNSVESGTTQKLVMVAAAGAVIAGLTLLPLGDDPA